MLDAEHHDGLVAPAGNRAVGLVQRSRPARARVLDGHDRDPGKPDAEHRALRDPE
jgi:hypothetical protein